MAYEDNDLGGLGAYLSPVMASGADPDELLASGDPAKYLAQLRAGAPSGTSAMQPQMDLGVPPPKSSLAMPSGQTTAQPIIPATNAPNPVSETTRTPAVPATVTPTGTATTPISAFARPDADANALEAKLTQAQAPQSPTNATGVPMVRDPNHPEYKPSAGRRIIRGLVAGAEGLAEHGLAGSLLGALDPEKVGATPYGSGTRQFSQAAQRNAMLQDSLKQQLGQVATNAETGLKQVQTDAGRLIEISPAQAQALNNPALAGTKVTQKSLDDLTRNANTVQGRKDVATINNQTKQEIADANNLTKEKIATLKPEQRDDRAIRIMSKPPNERTQEETAYLAGYSKWVDATKTQPGVQKALAYAQYRPVQTIDGDGNVHYDYAGNAIKSGAAAPASIPFKTMASVTKAFTTGPQAQTLNAYNTALGHIDLLDQASQALHNGDVQKVNLVGNRINQELGVAAPTTFNAIKTIMAGEIAKAVKNGVATDAEIKDVEKTINESESPEQLSGAFDAYRSLLSTKGQNLLQQYISGVQGQPDFGNIPGASQVPSVAPKSSFPNRSTPNAGGGKISVKAPDGKTYEFKDQKSADTFKRDAGIK